MKSILYVVATLVTLLIVFIAGARVGTNQFLLANAKYQSSLITYRLEMLREGKVDNDMKVEEMNLLVELDRHGQYLNSWLFWLWPELYTEDEKEILHAVRYFEKHKGELGVVNEQIKNGEYPNIDRVLSFYKQ